MSTTLSFKENEATLTLGVEIELQVMNKNSLLLEPRAPEIMQHLNHPKLTKELFQSMLEVITGVTSTAKEAAEDITSTLNIVDQYAKSNEIVFSSTGSHPTANYNERHITNSPRYHQLIDRNQWLSRRTSVYGLHIHLAMKNGDSCIDFSNFFVRQLPLLLVLSASSPFWIGRDSGLSCTRPTVYEAIPTCGLPYLFNNWLEFNKRYDELKAVGSIESMKDLWWDLRPSPGYGTLEIRICDGPATIAEMQAIVAFAHVLGKWYEENKNEYDNEHVKIPERWILRENKWKAIRHGLNADFILENSKTILPIREKILWWIEKTQPIIDKLNYHEEIKTILDIIQKGNSSERQRSIYSNTNSFDAVIKHNIEEYNNRKPIWNIENEPHRTGKSIY